MKSRVILQDILSLLPKDTYVGIWDCRRSNPKHPIGFEKHPTQQRYIKISNLPYERVRYLLGEEVYRIAHTEKGIFIQIMKNQDEVRDSLNNWDLVDKLMKRLEQQRGMIKELR